MIDLCSPRQTREILKKHGFSTRKKYGQNFLINPSILDEMIDAADISKDDFVLEIGPGIGTMTQRLCQRASHVTAVEIDKELIPLLDETLSEYTNKNIINADILKTDIKQISDTYNNSNKIKVVANLPYYITTPVIMELLKAENPIESITVMVQKEVAMRMIADPIGKEYGALSLAVQYYTEPTIICTIPPQAYIPPPKVDSAVVHLRMRSEPPVKSSDPKFMFALIKAAFAQRRKTLANAIANSAELTFPKDTVIEVINKCGFDINIRGEKLKLEDFALLSDRLRGESK